MAKLAYYCTPYVTGESGTVSMPMPMHTGDADKSKCRFSEEIQLARTWQTHYITTLSQASCCWCCY